MAQRIKIQDGIVVYQHADSAVDLDFYIDGTLHVRNNTRISGNVGIGTLTPTATLEVNGTARFGPTTVSGPFTVNGPATITAPLNGVTGTFSGSVSASSLTASGTVSGATAVISGSVNADAGIFGTSVTSPVFIGNFSGNASTATSLAGGTAGAVVYQSAPSTSAFLPAGTTSQVLISGASAPSWTGSPSGLTSIDAASYTGTTITLSGSVNADTGVFSTSVTAPNFYGSFSGPVSGNAATASALQTARTIATTGDATWVVIFDGSTNVTNPITLATVNSSPQSDTFRRITVNGKGLVTATSAVTNPDITTALGYTPVNKAGDTMLGYLILNAPPVNSLGAVTKQYVDDIASGLTIHAACITSSNGADLTATYSNGSGGIGATLTGTGSIPSIGGVTPVVGDRVLVKDQTAQLQNGIYVVTQATANWIMTRASDFDGSPSTEIQAGDAVYVQQGILAGTQWVQTTAGAITVGVTSIVFSQFGGPGTYTAGSGINIAGTSISNTGVLSNIAGSGISVSGATGNVTIGNTGVLSVAGTSNQITTSAATGSITLSLPSNVTISGTMTAALHSGSGASLTNIPNAGLVNSSITIGSTNIALGASSTTLTGLTSVTATTFNGNATSANIATQAISLQNSRTIQATGDATWSVNFDGSVNVSAGLTLATVNGSPQSDTFRRITVNGKGLVTATSAVTSGDITTSLGYTPYNSTNPAGYITSAPLANYLPLAGGVMSGMITSNTGEVLRMQNTGVYISGYNTAGSVRTGYLQFNSGSDVRLIAEQSNSAILGTTSGSLTISTSGPATFTHLVSAPAFNATSTKRVKKKVRNLSKSYLARFADLKPREYDRIDYIAHEFGFVAEEMNEVYPEVVGKDEQGRATGIDYGKLSTILTAKVQEQEKTIEELKKQMQEILALVKGSK